MPVVVAPQDYETWLTGDVDAALALLRPAPEGGLEAIPVGDRVNSADNDDPGLIEPVRPMRLDLFDGEPLATTPKRKSRAPGA